MQKGSAQKVEAGKDYPGGTGDFCLTIFKRARKKMQGAAGQSASPHSMKDCEANLPGSHFQACEKALYNNLNNGREHNLSRSSGSNELEGTSDTLGVGLPFRVM